MSGAGRGVGESKNVRGGLWTRRGASRPGIAAVRTRPVVKIGSELGRSGDSRETSGLRPRAPSKGRSRFGIRIGHEGLGKRRERWPTRKSLRGCGSLES